MKCGIEIHQRLSGRKLFCRCTSSQKQGNGPGNAIHFTRKLHAVRSEIGELDRAVKMESSRERAFSYAAPAHSSCLVEADEEPPTGMSREALLSALAICSLLSSKPVDELHIMRKNVIDGSNTSGFQRTAVIGIGGEIAIPSGKLGIQAVCIEEESAGIVESADGKAQYDLDRLGIPLVEIATAPTLTSGKDAQEAALAIGTLLRQTGLVMRGLGTIRQDLNISIPTGARVEIKGVQDLSMIEKTVDIEVKRQEAIILLFSEISKITVGGKPQETFFDLTEIFSDANSQFTSKFLKGGNRLFGSVLPGFSGFLGREIAPNRRLGGELADYARSAGVRGIIHSDESMEKYGISDEELMEIKAVLSLGKDDAFILVAADGKKAQAALSEALKRAGIFGVCEETRKANPDGTSSYMRPLPGRARLYPETDISLIEITKEMLSQAHSLAEGIEKAEEDKGEALSTLNEELRAQLSSARGLLSHNPSHKLRATTPEISVYMHAIESGTDSKFAASLLTNTLQSLKREGVNTTTLDEPRLLSLFEAYGKKEFTKQAAGEILRAMCSNTSLSPKEAAEQAGATRIFGKALASLIETEKLDLPSLMAKYRLRVDATEAKELMSRKK